MNRQIGVEESKYRVTGDPHLHVGKGSRDLLLKFRDPLHISETVGARIPSWMYRTYTVALGPVVAKLVNFSLTQCRVPLVWKTAHITQVRKTSPVTGAGDLRPISISPLLSSLSL